MDLITTKVVFISFLFYLALHEADSKCQPSFTCSNLTLEFPFTDATKPECGLLPVEGCNDKTYIHPRFRTRAGQFQDYIDIIGKESGNRMVVSNPALQDLLRNKSCLAFVRNNLTITPSVSFSFSPNLTFFVCYFRESDHSTVEEYFRGYNRTECQYSNVYYDIPHDDDLVAGKLPPPGCYAVRLPMSNNDTGNVYDRLTAEFTVEWSVSEDCKKCYNGGGQCLTDNQDEFYCKKEKSGLKLILALCVSGAGAGVVVLLLMTHIVRLRKKKPPGYLRPRNTPSPSNSNMEAASDVDILTFGIPVFSYSELEEATNSFHSSNVVGDGGFATVYHGNLKDGREVAIKYLYEHNYNIMEQFLNEIKILTALRHPNLVYLYGCTSTTSQKLLLVYEYVSNGTVADHLHGDRADEALLTWPIRMKIAIETAAALAYLHKSDIIHRDVKTCNILLDTNFGVKVADFGLSRLFSNELSHISTAPQGTPGYVDPEYYQSYRLTNKSDVYSFGVVLIELVSSMPAVDVNRHRHEINLANLALDRIQRRALDELVDSSLGHKSDAEVRRMTRMVAELAFQCLQADKDLRPSMDEVVECLDEIKGGDDVTDDAWTNNASSTTDSVD